MLILLTLYKLCAVLIRHIISTGEDVKYKQVNHQVLVLLGGGGGGGGEALIKNTFQ